LQLGAITTRSPFGISATKRIVAIAFDSMDNVQAWQNSDAMKAFASVRAKYAKVRKFAVELRAC